MLACFDMDIRYISTLTNSAADALSHYSDVQQPERDHTAMDDLVELYLITTVAEIDSDIMDTIRAAYPEDRLFGPVIANPEMYPAYSILDGLIYHNE